MSSDDYNTGGDGGGNEKSGRPAPSPATECDVGLGLNMQYTESTNYPNKTMNFMSNPSPYQIEFGGGYYQIASGTSFKYTTTTTTTTGGEMKKMIFTASQWREFENQTMIYKHIMSSIPVPPQLLLPLSIQSNRSDSEPWRCRRTDGKKWRCSRDVMPDQKYCERHAHKNRPRSRKLVETHSHNTTKSKDNYHLTLPPATNMPTSCEQSRFMKSGTIPLSSSNIKIQKSMHYCSPSVGSKRDHFLQNLEGHHQDFVGDNCSLTLSMQHGGGNDTCHDDQDLFQLGIGTLNGGDGLSPRNEWLHQGSWLGGPLGEALCIGLGSSSNRPSNVSSSQGYSNIGTSSSSCQVDAAHELH